jgi:hypothetical protein
MQLEPDRHIEDDDLERYSMRTLGETQTPALEEHLLFCHSCQNRLYEMDQFLESIRAVAPGVSREKETLWLRLRKLVTVSWPTNYPAWAAASAVLALVCLVGLTWQFRQGATGKPIAVVLVAERGGAVTAPANRALLLELDTKGLPNMTSYRLQVVDQFGARVAESSVSHRDGRIKFPVGAKLAAGDYLVRLFSPQGEQLREFAVRLH